MTYGQLFKAIRKRGRWTCALVGERIGLTHSYLGLIERGERPPLGVARTLHLASIIEATADETRELVRASIKENGCAQLGTEAEERLEELTQVACEWYGLKVSP